MTNKEKDILYNWHPYTQHKTAFEHPVITHAKNEIIYDEDGKEYIDAICSWWANPFGHSNKNITQAISKQLQTLDHVLFGGFTHLAAINLSEKLSKILPSNLNKFFYSDNGSTAVEVALKASLQYFYNKNNSRYKIIAFEDAFHGDTFGAMATSGISLFNHAFKNSLLKVDRITLPNDNNINTVVKTFTKMVKSNEYAAFIFEPLVLGAAGMKFYKPEYLDTLIKISKENQVITIADEVMTGFGKTGKTFAIDYLKEKPDAICVSKALTGGTIPLAVTVFSKEIYNAFYHDDTAKAFFHGHTFTANPTGCAAALAAIDVLNSNKMKKGIENISKKHQTFINKIKNHKKIKSIAYLGVILSIELNSNENDYYGNLRNKLYHHFISNGIIIRPVGNIIYTIPPYIIKDNNLKKIYKAIEDALEII